MKIINECIFDEQIAEFFYQKLNKSYDIQNFHTNNIHITQKGIFGRRVAVIKTDHDKISVFCVQEIHKEVVSILQDVEANFCEYPIELRVVSQAKILSHAFA